MRTAVPPLAIIHELERHWYYVEWSPLGALRAVPVIDVHRRNSMAMTERSKEMRWIPLALCPSLDSALETMRLLKREKAMERPPAEPVALQDRVEGGDRADG